MWKLNGDETKTSRTAAVMVLDAMNAVIKECDGQPVSASYLKEKILKATGWLSILNSTIEMVLDKEEGKEKTDDTVRTDK